jgi:hypothetical protein
MNPRLIEIGALMLALYPFGELVAVGSELGHFSTLRL